MKCGRNANKHLLVANRDLDFEILINNSMKLLELFQSTPAGTDIELGFHQGNQAMYNISVHRPQTDEDDTGFDAYMVSMDKVFGDVWEVLFSLEDDDDGTTKITGSAGWGAAKVFGAVTQCMKDFVKKTSVKGYYFSAVENEPSRVRMYYSYSKVIARMFGWIIFDKIKPSTLNKRGEKIWGHTAYLVIDKNHFKTLPPQVQAKFSAKF